MAGSFYLPLVLLSAVVGVGFAVFSWRHRSRPGVTALGVFLLGASLWALAEGLTVALGQYDSMVFWTSVALSVSVALPVAWLVFVLQYTGTVQRMSRTVLAVLVVEPVLFLALVWTNGRHETVWSDPTVTSVGSGFNVVSSEFGLAFWGHQAYSYILLALGMVLLLRMLLGTNERTRLQGTLLLGSIFVPTVLNALNIFGFLPSGLDPTGIGYILAGVGIAGVVLEPELARVAPVTREVGREAVLSELDDAILILDGENHLVDHNPAATQLLTTDGEALGQTLTTVSPGLASQLETSGEHATISLETAGERREFDVRVSELSGAYGVLSGRVVSLRDVTERRQREQRLDVLNRLLRHNIRNELNVVRGKIELMKKTIDGETGLLDDAIESLDGIVARSNKVSRLSRLLEADESGPIDIATELRGEFQQGPRNLPPGRVEFEFPEELFVAGGPSLVSAFDELVTNALVHNDSEEPTVRIALDESESDDSSVVIAVCDNGPGIDQQEVDTLLNGEETPLQHSSGVGLWLVHWLVLRVGGTLSFENNDGCTVAVRLPRANAP